MSIQTLRHYERPGLLAEPDRSNGGHRSYGEEAVVALRVITAAQRLGFTFQEVAELLEAGRHRHGRPVAGLQERARVKLAVVDAKIADRTTIRTAPAAAVATGCDDLTACAGSACCPNPFTDRAKENRHAGPCCRPRPHRAPKALGGLAALACVACCARPVLITAGVVGAGAGGRWVGRPRSPSSWSCSPPAPGGSAGAGVPAPAGREPQERTGAAARGRASGSGPAVDIAHLRRPSRGQGGDVPPAAVGVDL